MSTSSLSSFECHHLRVCPVHKTWAWILKHTPKPASQNKAMAVASHKSELWLTLYITEKYLEVLLGDKELHVALWDSTIYHTLGSCVWPKAMLSGAGWWILLLLSDCHACSPVYWGSPCGVLFLLDVMGQVWHLLETEVLWVLPWQRVRRPCCTWAPAHLFWHGSYIVPSHQTEEPSCPVEKQRCTTCFSAGTTLSQLICW